MQQPWHKDTPIDDSAVRTIISQHTHRQDDKIQKLDEGWDTEIYLVNDDLIFRFAKREFVIPFILTEIQALPILGRHLSCPIPGIMHHGLFNTKYPFFVYKKLPGTIATNLSLTNREKEALIMSVTDFLNELHSIRLTDEIRAIIPPDNIGRLDIAKRAGHIKDRIHLAKELSNPIQGTSIQGTSMEMPASYSPAIDGPSSTMKWLEDLTARITQKDVVQHSCLVHGDLYARNTLVKDRRTLSGIIDWTDIHIGHPAKDLAFAVSFFSPGALRRVIDRYHGFTPAFFYLANLSALNLTFRLTEYALDIKSTVLMDECKTSFINLQDNYSTFANAW